MEVAVFSGFLEYDILCSWMKRFSLVAPGRAYSIAVVRFRSIGGYYFSTSTVVACSYIRNGLSRLVSCL